MEEYLPYIVTVLCSLISGFGSYFAARKQSKTELQKLIDDYDTGRIIKNGIKTVIIGPPNAGKSTLMNLLSGYDRSIVTEIAGERVTVEVANKVFEHFCVGK